jgi:hypothetical protein
MTRKKFQPHNHVKTALTALTMVATVAFAPVSNAALATFAEDFDALNINSSLALFNWTRYTSVWFPGPVGTGFLYDYSGSAANASSGSGQMSAVATGEGANGVGDQYLNVFTDYANADLAAGAYLSVNIFQEQTIAIGDIGSSWTFDFSGKGVGDEQFRLAPPATGTAFIKTLDPNAGFAQTNLVSVDTSAMDFTTWSDFSLSIDLSDPLLAGQILQFGFNVDTVGTGPTGNYYDNVNFGVTPVPVPAAVWLFGSGLLGLVGVARRRKS